VTYIEISDALMLVRTPSVTIQFVIFTFIRNWFMS